MIPHVQLANGDLVIQLPSGPVTRTKYQFHYHKILHIIKNGTIDELLPFLEPVVTSNGVYLLYMTYTLYVRHVEPSAVTCYTLIDGVWTSNISAMPPESCFVTPFLSFEEIQATYPEYFI